MYKRKERRKERNEYAKRNTKEREREGEKERLYQPPFKAKRQLNGKEKKTHTNLQEKRKRTV